MSCLRAGCSVYGSYDIIFKDRARVSSRVCSSVETLHFKELISKDHLGRTLDTSDQRPLRKLNMTAPKLDRVSAQPSVCIGEAQRWWEKSLQPNMIEIQSAQDLVDFLLNAGDKLVALNFYSPGCGGCKTLHPKICQLAEVNPYANFLKVNYEQHKAMCHALHVHVLPFFRFYRGAEGRVCSFSCTNATIKKFKDALSKHGTDRCSLGPAKGLGEEDMVALASLGLISRDALVLDDNSVSYALSKDDNSKIGFKEGNPRVIA